MLKLKIESACVLDGVNRSAGVMLELDALKKADIDVLVGAGLARIVEVFPVPAAVEVSAPVSTSKKDVKKKSRK